MDKNLINHVALVLDRSSSMGGRERDVIAVVDGLVKHLASRSTETGMETRVTVYTFSSTTECVVFDKDVLRLPSIAKHYVTRGQTALLDATLLSQHDLAQTAQMYGDHSFLTYVITDGAENASSGGAQTKLSALLSSQPENWTVGVLVPNIYGKSEAKRYGFPSDNIAIWDVNSVDGVAEVGETIRTSYDSYVVSRTSGTRGTKNLFAGTGAATLNKDALKSTGMKPLASDAYVLIPVHVKKIAISEFVRGSGLVFRVGQCFYQLNKLESIQANKQVAVVDKKTAKVYIGNEARQLIGLPDMEVRIKPETNPDFDVYIQSTSNNRNLFAGTKLLYIK